MQANALMVGVAAWCVPGAGHFLVGQTRKAVIFLAVLGGMFFFGLGFGGELFPFQMAEPLVFLAALAQWALLVPRAAAAILGAGGGDVVAVTYEYGNTFLIVSGLLNTLVVFDALDLARGVKRR
jgi:hypothetical protein